MKVGVKICKDCGKEKNLDAFYVSYVRNGKECLRPECKDCNMKRSSSWSKKNPSKRNHTVRKSGLKKYGMSMADYENLLKEQDNKCAICGTDAKLLTKKLSADHSHKTGKVRGLLCQLCNAGLGMFMDSMDLLDSARRYLEKNNA